MAEKFKTGYLADPVSYTAVGKAIGAQISDSFKEISQRQKQNQIELDSRMGFTKAQNESLPTGMSGRYMKGAQTLLEDMQEKAAVAYSTGNAPDVAAYQQAKREYNDFKNIGVAVSQRERQVVDNVSIGAFPNLGSTVAEALDDYTQHDKGNFTIQGGQMVFIDGDGSEKYWRESRVGDIQGGFLPQLKWEGSDYMVRPLSDDIYTTNLSNREGLYQEKFEGTDFMTGELDSGELYSDVQRLIDNKMISNPNEMADAISIHGYKVNEAPNKTELSQSDIVAARTVYDPAAFIEGKTFLAGKLNSNGEFVFDKEIENFPDVVAQEQKEKIINARRAKKAYYESVGGDLVERITLDNEAGKYAAELNEAAAEMSEAAMEAAADNAELLNSAPSIIVSDDGAQFTVVHSSDSRYKGRMEGRPIVIEETVFNDLGEEIGYKVSSSKTKQDAIAALLDSGNDTQQARAVIDDWFNKYDNQVISMTKMVNGQQVIDPNFLRIKAGLNNGIFASGNKPASETQRALAGEKIRLYGEGELEPGSLMRGGISRVATAPAASPAASPAATPATTSAAAPATAPAPAPTANPSPIPPAQVPSQAAQSSSVTPTQVSRLDETPTTPVIEFDNLAMSAAALLQSVGASDSENYPARMDFYSSPAADLEKLQDGMIPVAIASDSDGGSTFNYIRREELESMSPKQFQEWKAKQIEVSEEGGDVSAIEVPVSSAAVESEEQAANVRTREAANEERSVETYVPLEDVLDTVADVDENVAEQVQDFLEGLNEENRKALEENIRRLYSTQQLLPRVYTSRDGSERITFVTSDNPDSE